ncbi:MAG: hypothetical protein R2838_19810 [Caldilineaceae bacterium]
MRTTNDAYLILKQEMVKLLQSDEPLHIDEAPLATVVLVVGVNGSGQNDDHRQDGQLVQGTRAQSGARRSRHVCAAAIDQLGSWSAPAWT